ncbi:hypothetical protein [Fulvimonas soli]|uniref:Uncharacterized protein n=1 Tax=Fulvimonas soli TaxID=155197 RepID=A0A316I5N6_9GAMM|nr:hypothetical protein [Fulvimonas soli]PWK87760.1 hypothetical protein C7456_106253 [Fulvimonas soli]TNY26527.1 hypothetical protein BV497_08270 [Fulvimonas soli]
MSPIRAIAPAIVLLALAAPPAATADIPRPGDGRTAPPHFYLVNASFDSVTSLAVAPAGSGDFRDIELGRPLQGGLDAVTVDLPAGGCLRDFRVGFRDGRILRLPAIDVCRRHGLRLTAK